MTKMLFVCYSAIQKKFISDSEEYNDVSLINNICINTNPASIANEDDIIQLQKFIEVKTNLEDVKIINFRRME